MVERFSRACYLNLNAAAWSHDGLAGARLLAGNHKESSTLIPKLSTVMKEPTSPATDAAKRERPGVEGD